MKILRTFILKFHPFIFKNIISTTLQVIFDPSLVSSPSNFQWNALFVTLDTTTIAPVTSLRTLQLTFVLPIHEHTISFFPRNESNVVLTRRVWVNRPNRTDECIGQPQTVTLATNPVKVVCSSIIADFCLARRRTVAGG
ncbi:hypothetical protein M427DRAFT_54934 [Gonapodya prolifera JEL478]|uniref:Uncharacterized protein n=1 Tax=Gonapodya prolifera (strain JEL478) TaxID=1344416 RepID=A0A138ZWF0_GONPJ|nr:hypothetical protein M427DRAFT_65088 [Gonapodya prolifera JEL478]KXS17283.1 hypothetical protein M427DRAFT_54934 [Gonapodya prolifera JEL478]|eukprot:KXS08839.1 hypothetical protein M427DRAFT_65088 [Gonapodya prolifera JEL478]